MTQTKKKLGKVSVDTFGPKANFFFSILMTLVGLTGIFPFIFVIILSLTDESSIVRNGYRLIPDAWSTAGYEYLYLANRLKLSFLPEILHFWFNHRWRQGIDATTPFLQVITI